MAETEPLRGNGGALPSLSPTFQATQLLTPSQLDRITIDQPHYHGHLKESVSNTQPPLKNAVQRRLGRMGDNHFFLQKELPITQVYAKTTLQLSQVRPWDQIVERPLKSANMTKKEVNLPFPQEHPYTSHMSRFAVFPDTSQHSSKTDAQTQTGSVPNPPTLYYVSQKAGEWGQRVEQRHFTTPGHLAIKPGTGTLLWDLPRSQRHKRAVTYPAPSLQYSRPPTAAKYLPLPSTIQPSDSCSAVSPVSQGALDRIHRVLTRTTTYAEQYSAPGTPRGLQNVLQMEYSFRSRESHRPWTAESRGKYSSVAGGAVPLDRSFLDASCEHGWPLPQLVTQHSDDDEHYSRQEKEEVSGNEEPGETEEDQLTDEETPEDKKVHMPVKIDASTQTEEQYFEQVSTNTELPSLVRDTPDDNKPTHFNNVSTTTGHRPLSAVFPQMEQSRELPRSHQSSRPRTAESTRKLMSLYNGFNKTEVLRRFHSEFPEQAPDLRGYSVREGKRHIIHGSHAYYYH